MSNNIYAEFGLIFKLTSDKIEEKNIMKKRLTVLTIALCMAALLFCGVAAASPLADLNYPQGSIGVGGDYSWSFGNQWVIDGRYTPSPRSAGYTDFVGTCNPWNVYANVGLPMNTI